MAYTPGILSSMAANAEGSIGTLGSNIPSGFTSASSLSGVAASTFGQTALFPSVKASGKSDRLAEVLPRSALALVKGGNLTNVASDLTDRGTIAQIKLITNRTISQLNSSGSGQDISAAFSSLKTGVFSDFLLTEVDFEMTEKVQVSQTMGDAEVVYYFGRQPMMMSMAGILIDSLSDNWFTQFISLYVGFMRGSELAINRELVQIILPNMTVVGSFNSLRVTQSAAVDTNIQFTAQFLVKSITPTPAMSMGALNYTPSSSTGNILNWSVGRGGYGGVGFSSLIQSAASGLSKIPILDAGLGAVHYGEAAALSHFNALSSFAKGIFSPVFTILSNVTTVVQTVMGDLTSLVSGFTGAINNVLGTISSILNKTASIVTTVEHDFAASIGQIEGTIGNFYSTLQLARNTMGIISSLPQTLSQTLQTLPGPGTHAFSLFFSNSGKPGVSPFLQSGAAYNPVAPYALSL